MKHKLLKILIEELTQEQVDQLFHFALYLSEKEPEKKPEKKGKQSLKQICIDNGVEDKYQSVAYRVRNGESINQAIAHYL